MFSCLLFALALSSVGDVPIPYGMMACRAADAAGVKRVELGALLLAENHGGVYDPTARGKHGQGGEYGLTQVHGGWARFCGVKRGQLLEAATNIECGARVIAELQRWHGIYCKRRRYPRHDWRAHWRCSNHPRWWTSPDCRGSVARVLRHQDRLAERYLVISDWWPDLRPAPRSPDPDRRPPRR